MISKDQLPEDPAEWGDLEVSFPRLSPDTADSCPIPFEEVMEYVRMESADYDQAQEESLRFLRTAQVNDDKFWLWSYTESDGELCYVVYRQSPDGSSLLGLSSAQPDMDRPHVLSPEQYLVAEYYDLVYW